MSALRQFLALSLVMLVGGCGSDNTFVPPPPPQVSVAQPIRRPVVDSVEFTGTTRAAATVEVRSRVTGYLKKINFEDGATVKEGDLLFVIDQEPFKAQLAAAVANKQKAVAGLQLAQANLARTSQLSNQGASSRQELDVRIAERATSEAEVNAAEAAVRSAQLNLEYTEIRAPISGRIGRHLVDRGNIVQAEQTILAVIESIDPIHVYFHVSEADLLRFMQMIRQHELPNPSEKPPVLYTGLMNEPGYPHKGYLDYRELGVDPTTGTILRRGVIKNPDHTLIPGLFARIRAPVGSPQPRLLVEERSIGSDQRGDFLLTVNDKNIVEYRPVKIGISVGELRVIENGIDASDWVIVNGLQRARPGAKVNPERSQMKEAASSPAAPVSEPARQKDAKNATQPKSAAKSSAGP